MEVNILKDSKEEVEVEFNSLTLVELVRVYLNNDSSVTFVAWRREHPTKNPVLLVKTKGKTAKKAINDAVSSAIKDLDKLESDFEKN